MKRIDTTTGVLAAAFAAAASMASAETYSAAIYLPQSYAQAKFAYTEMFDRVREETDGEMNFETFYSGSLLPAKTTVTGIRDGVAQVGFVYPPYTPADLPIADFLNNASFASEDSLATALAYTEINFSNEALRAEWEQFGIVFGGAFATPEYYFLCNEPLTGVAQARGKRMRTAGKSFTEIATSLSAAAVSVPIGDAYSGMQRGSLDCILADPTNLISASFNEVVTGVTEIGLGLVPGANWAYNKDFWDGLDDDQRALLKREMALAMIRTQAEFARNVKESLEDARARDIAVSGPDADLAEHIANFKTEYINNLIANSEGRFDADAQAIFDEYTALQDKWSSLLEGVDRTDEAAVLAIVEEADLMGKLGE